MHVFYVDMIYMFSPLIAAAAYGQIQFTRNLLSTEIMNTFKLHDNQDINNNDTTTEEEEEEDRARFMYSVDINIINLVGQTALIYAGKPCYFT